MKRIEEMLWNKTTDELTKMCSQAGIKGRSGAIKAEKIKLLCEFFSNENWVKEVFEALPKYEKEMMTCIIQNKYNPERYLLEKIQNKYKKNKYSYSSSYFDRDSKANLFYIGWHRSIPEEIKEKLNELVEPIKIEIKATKENIEPEDFYANIVGRENRVQDFDEFIKFINVSKIKATKTKEQMPKSAVIKIHNKLQYRDVLKNDEIDFNSIRNIEDTIVSNGIVNLLKNSSTIKVKKGVFSIDEKACEEYQKLNKIEKIKYLLNSYIDPESKVINECNRIEGNNFRLQNKTPYLGKARKIILEYLKKCPIDKWIDVSEIKKYIRINEYGFLRKYVGEVLIKDQYYNSYYNTASHDEFESCFIEVVLMEYLATLGIVDVVMSQSWDDYGYEEFLVVDYFRITKLGSYVLDMAEEENIEEDNDKIIITPNFDIIVGEISQKLKYELYFDRFLNKKSENPLMYKLDFKGMSKALELGIKFKDIYTYLQQNCKDEIPKNVKAQMEDWIEASKKIRIKTLTVLEVDRNSFREIVGNEDFRSYIDSIRDDVIVLKNNKIEDVKKELNRSGKFCI